MSQEAELYFKLNFDYIKGLQKEARNKGKNTFGEIKKYIVKKTSLTPSILMLCCDTLEEYNKLKN